MMPQYRGLYIGRGPFRARWISICSAHRYFDAGCECCSVGFYSNCVAMAFSDLFYRVSPRLWNWWANRKWNL